MAGAGWIFTKSKSTVSEEENSRAAATEQLALTAVAVFSFLLAVRLAGTFLSRASR